jgi:addiction module RelE/StbE family toxin
MKVRWAAPALRDLEAIGDYIARDNPAAAARVVTRIFEQADFLASHPHAGRAGRVPGTRELVVSDTPFILPYRIEQETVEVLAVFHGARRWPENFN